MYMIPLDDDEFSDMFALVATSILAGIIIVYGYL